MAQREPTPAPEVEWLRVREAATIARVSAPTVLTWVHQALFEAARLPGGYRIRRASFEAFLRGCRPHALGSPTVSLRLLPSPRAGMGEAAFR